MLPLIGMFFELTVTALFATVFSYFAMQLLHKVQDKKMPKYHLFNKKELFFNNFFTAMIIVILLKIFDWKEVFYTHKRTLFML
jgi:hypothetical protein